ncbi:Transcription initiation factore TFIID subunit 6 [Carpediemonas membranifera]|uniref:Transcription initiation factore TFIID subunit 6 n=1 Tax=Carpediemonas membranifera TaxID=201153 RepID=A0A8J6E1J6_9EUKA|nr:Transcription initiation factore TFIID subunit 6 [Carpediemonas membranifera]|eukprot:KAG9393146.1 Transcription initiation factore TFIID subunit 6 [Carpediemonas membranifera]
MSSHRSVALTALAQNVSSEFIPTELDDAVASIMADELQFRLANVLSLARRFAYQSPDNKLTADDVNEALKTRNMNVVLGPSSRSSRYRTIGNGDTYCVADDVVNINELLNSDPRRPAEPSLSVHWLAVTGKMPATNENVSVEALERAQNDIVETILPEDFDANPPVTQGARGALTDAEHGLSYILHRARVMPQVSQEFLHRVKDALKPLADESKRAEVEAALPKLCAELRTHRVSDSVPFIVREALATIMKNLADDLFPIRAACSLLAAVWANSSLRPPLESSLQEVLPALVTMVVTETLGPYDPEDITGRDVREEAAKMLAEVLFQYGGKYPKMQESAFEFVREALLAGPRDGFYGALLVVGRFGESSVNADLVPLLPDLLDKGKLKPCPRFLGSKAFPTIESTLMTVLQRCQVADADTRAGLGERLSVAMDAEML